jgi:hypothetical protein
VDEVFLLWHVHELGGGDEDAKLIGVYRSRGDAEAALNVLAHNPVSPTRGKDLRFALIA